MFKRTAVLILSCCLISGCSCLVREEKERALAEAYEKGKIDKVEYLTSKSKLEQAIAGPSQKRTPYGTLKRE